MSVSVCLSVSVSVCSIRSDVGQCLQVTKPYCALSTVTSRVCVSVCLSLYVCLSLCLSVASGLTLDSVYKSLNRTVLYLLSRPVHSVTDQMALLDALHRLTSHRSLILGPGNFDQEFIGCLCYCLLQLTANCPENIRSATHTHICLRLDA